MIEDGSEAALKTPSFSRAAFWSALVTSASTLIGFGVAVTTPPRSGPFATPGSALAYPYEAAGRFVPRDFVWMYFVLAMLVAYLVFSVCLRERAPHTSRVWATLGLSLAVTAFAVLALDYFVQIFTIQPSLIGPEAADVVTLSQYNPHGFFIALENLGYLCMALSFGAFALTLGRTRPERAARRVLGGAAVAGAIAFVVMSLVYGVALEYRFEVAIITIDYFALMVGGGLAALAFRRAGTR